MIVVNNILANKNFFPELEYLPEKYIIRNVLQNGLKCTKIEIEESSRVLKVFWSKE
jgi:hypothetical protein